MAEEPTDPVPSAEPTDDSPAGSVTVTLERIRLDRMRVALWTVTVALLAALLYVGWRYVGTVVMGVFLYYVARPVFRRINLRITQRTLAVGATLLLVALPVLVIVGWAFVILADSLDALLGSNTLAELDEIAQPYFGLIAEFETFVGEVLADPSRLGDLELGSLLGDLVGSLAAAVGVAFNVGIHAFIVLIIVFYLLRDDYRISRWARDTFVEEDGVLESYFVTVDRDLHNVYFGNILNALVTGLLAATVYSVLNLFAPSAIRIPEAAFLGLLVGVASLVPVVGIKLVTWPVGAYLLVRALWVDPEAIWFPVVFLLVSFVVVDYIPDQLLRPYVSGRTLHVGAVMLAYTIGPLLFGWYGIFLAPLLFVTVFEFGRIVFPWLLAPDRFDASPPDPLGGTPDDRAAETDAVDSETTGGRPTSLSDDGPLPGAAESQSQRSE